MKIILRIANGIDYIEQVKSKIAEYTTCLGRDLSFQHIDEELSNPAIKYAPPQGELLVALDDEWLPIINIRVKDVK